MGVPVKVWLGGEGPNELGGRGQDPPTPRAGVLEVLLQKVEPEGWQVAGATTWSRIRKFRSGVHDGEARSVLGLVLQAFEEGAEVVAFARDTDSDPDRAAKIEAAIVRASAIFNSPPIGIIGGPARPAIEGWVLALAGERDTDSMSRARTTQRLGERAIDLKKTEAYLAVVESAVIGTGLPPGCESLETWLARARAVLSVAVHGIAEHIA